MNSLQNYGIVNYQPNFKANSKYIEKINNDIIKIFEKTHSFDQEERNRFGRIEHFVFGVIALCFATIDIITQRYGGLLLNLVFANINFGLDKMFHNIAMRKSQVLVRYLKSQGMNDKKQIMGIVDLYLKKRGGVIYSTFVRKFQKNKIKQVANGESASQFKGIMTYIRDKFTLLSHNNAQKIKAKRNIKTLVKACRVSPSKFLNCPSTVCE